MALAPMDIIYVILFALGAIVVGVAISAAGLLLLEWHWERQKMARFKEIVEDLLVP